MKMTSSAFASRNPSARGGGPWVGQVEGGRNVPMAMVDDAVGMAIILLKEQASPFYIASGHLAQTCATPKA